MIAGPYVYGDRLEEVVAHHARLRPQAEAVRQDASSLTYAELVGRAERVASALRAEGVEEGDHVPILIERGIEFVVALLAVLRAGASYIALDPRWPAQRSRTIIERSRPRIVVDEGHLSRWLSTELDPLPPPRADGRAAACVFFTSGSTGAPKGAISPHRGTIRTLVNHAEITLDADTTFLQAAPLPWDGLSLELWAPLLNGGRSVLLGKNTPVLDVAAWESALDSGVNSMWLTSSLFSLFADERPALFARLRLLLVGGERVSPEHVRRVLAAAPGLRVINGYGPAENTIFTTTHLIRPADVANGAADIPIGRLVPQSCALLLDEDGAEVAPGAIGELAVGGDGLALGYLADPKETSRHFFRRHGRSWYRTGDLALVDDEGLYRFRGRADRQVKIGGVRVEPGEIETVLARHPDVRSAYVRIGHDTGNPVVGCLYSSLTGQPIEGAELTQFIRERLLPPMWPAVLTHVAQLPLNANGKVDQVLAGLLIDATDHDLVAGGLTSLDAIRLAAQLTIDTGQHVTLADVYRSGTRSGLTEAASTRPTPAAAHPDLSPLSHAQQRFWLAELTRPGIADNMLVLAYELTGPVRVGVLRDAVQDVQRANTALRTVYLETDDEPVQRVLPVDATELSVDVMTVGPVGSSRRALAEQVTDDWWDTPFEFDRRPPVRFRLCRLEENRHLLCLHIHHIAFDGWSELSFVRQLARSYRARVSAARPDEPVRDHRDFVVRERQHLQAWRAELLPFWRRQLRDMPAPFLPLPPARLGEATRRDLALPVEAARVALLARAARQHGVPLAGVFTAGVARALGQVFGVDEVGIGSVFSGRTEPALDDLIGYLVNPLALAVRDVRTSTPTDLLSRVGNDLVSALDHSALPFDDIVQAVGAARGRHPWFQAWAVLQAPRPDAQLADDLLLAPLRLRPPRTSIELMMEAYPESDGGWSVVQLGRTDGVSDPQAAAVQESFRAFCAEVIGA